MKDTTRDFAFVLANTDLGYILTTYKVGSITVQSNATDFLQFFKYVDGKFINFGANRIHKGDPALVTKIFNNEPVTCLLRDPYSRTVTGIVQELLAHEYKHYPGAHKLASANPILLWLTERYFFPFDTIEKGSEIHQSHAESHKMIRNIVESFMTQDVFQAEWEKWWQDVIPFTWDKLKLSQHIRKYNEPLYYFLKGGNIKQYNTRLLSEVKFEHNYFHSNWMFKKPIEKALINMVNNDFNEFIEKETEYFNCLKDGTEKVY